MKGIHDQGRVPLPHLIHTSSNLEGFTKPPNCDLGSQLVLQIVSAQHMCTLQKLPWPYSANPPSGQDQQIDLQPCRQLSSHSWWLYWFVEVLCLEQNSKLTVLNTKVMNTHTNNIDKLRCSYTKSKCSTWDYKGMQHVFTMRRYLRLPGICQINSLPYFRKQPL
jgi:hypothetical protein